MARKTPGIYIAIRGDYSAFNTDMLKVKQLAKAQAEDIAKSINNAVSAADLSSGIYKITRELKTAQAALSAGAFKGQVSGLEEIAKAFKKAKAENLRRFLAALEECANEYLEKLSARDFHGEIRLRQTVEDSTEIKLYSSNGTEIKNPSGSQETVMYMSVLFAISDFTDQKRDENYPLIFDAATSSFGDSKEEGFYNVIDKIKKQCIIVTKDFITKGQLRLNEVDKLTCGVYRIRKADNFDSHNMATIRTIVDKIK